MEMAVMRVHKTANYTIMSNYHFKEKEMSLKAKGLLSLMLSLPDDWDYSINGLATLSKDGRDSVMGALKELENFGYLIRTRLTDEKGKFKGYDYDIFEEPHLTEKEANELKEISGDSLLPKSDNPSKEKPYTENPNTGNPTQLNTKRINDEGINNLNNQDKKDKLDKRAEAPSNIDKIKKFQERLENVLKPNTFSKELIKSKYIEEDDLFLSLYNQFFMDLLEDFEFEQVRSCLWYFIKRIDENGEVYDENGNKVLSKFKYMETAILNGLARISNDYDPFSENAIQKTLELFNK